MKSKRKLYSRRRPARKTHRRRGKSKRILKKYRKSRGNRKSKRISRKKRGGLVKNEERIIEYIYNGDEYGLNNLVTRGNLSVNTIINNIDEFKGRSLLNIAIETGNEVMVRYLLEKGAKVTQTGAESPLMYAVTVLNPNINIIEHLIQYGGDPFLCHIRTINPNTYSTPFNVVKEYLADYKKEDERAKGYLAVPEPRSNEAKEYLGDYNKEENDKKIKLYEDIITILTSVITHD